MSHRRMPCMMRDCGTCDLTGRHTPYSHSHRLEKLKEKKASGLVLASSTLLPPLSPMPARPHIHTCRGAGRRTRLAARRTGAGQGPGFRQDQEPSGASRTRPQ
eukprot:scaffold7380_cov115-Isochrysis_galbana.AAC.8